MKKRSLVFFLLCLLLLSGCTDSRRSVINDMTAVLKSPKLTDLPLQGVWEVNEVDYQEKNTTGKELFKKGDKLYVDPEFVALGDAITTAPSFSSKYVKLQDYLAMRNVKKDFGVKKDAQVFVGMVRDTDLFSMDLILLPNRKLVYCSGSTIYLLEQKNGVVPTRNKDEIMTFAKTNEKMEKGTAYNSHITTLIGIRTKKISNAGIPYYRYSSFLISDQPTYERPLVYKMNRLFVLNQDNIAYVLDYKTTAPDINNGVMNGIFTYHALQNSARYNQQVLRDKRGRGITFLQGNTISFDKPAQYPAQKDTPKKYEIQRLDKLSEDRPLSVAEIGGETEVKAMKEQVNAQLSFLDPNGEIDPKRITVDESNIGIIRRNISWGFVTSMNWLSGEKRYSSQVNIDVVPLIKMFNAPAESMSWARITNKAPLATTASGSPAADRLWIKNEDELLYYRSTPNHVEIRARLSIQLDKDTEMVSIRYFYDEQGEQVREQFTAGELTQPQVIYSEPEETLRSSRFSEE